MKWLIKDKWFAPDKLQHLTMCFMIATIFNWWVALGIGILKEIYDGLFGSGFSYKDLIADCIGIGIVLYLGIL